MLKRNRNKKASIISSASDALLSAVERLEQLIWERIMAILARLDREGGKVSNNATNELLLLTVDRDILGLVTDGLSSGLSPYLENFDQVELLNRLIYGGFLSDEEAVKVSRMVFSRERTFLVDEVTQSLTAPAVVRANVVQPIRRLLYSGIVFREPISTLQSKLKEEVLSSEGSSSRLLRYTRQISQDAIGQFDGAIQDRVRDEIGADGFAYVGSVIKTTRANCSELITGSGRFADLAIEPSIYAVTDLPKIIDRAKGRSGWNQNCTPQTFAQYRGGYGCRHEVIYFPLSDEQAKKRLKKSL